MISKEQVSRIAKLARLNFTEQEINKHQKDLSVILDYIEKLKKDKNNVIEKQKFFQENKNVFRKDDFVRTDKAEKQDLINLMPLTKDNYLKVKEIF